MQEEAQECHSCETDAARFPQLSQESTVIETADHSHPVVPDLELDVDW